MKMSSNYTPTVANPKTITIKIHSTYMTTTINKKYIKLLIKPGINKPIISI
jgi:hypothetical protein